MQKLGADPYVTNRKGIFEYLVGGSVAKKLLAVRVFDEKVNRATYAKQTQAVKGKGKSNCPLCAIGHEANKARIYDFDEMDADDVAAWSKGGDSSATNCQMLNAMHKVTIYTDGACSKNPGRDRAFVQAVKTYAQAVRTSVQMPQPCWPAPQILIHPL